MSKLHDAVKRGDFAQMKRLFDAGSDVNAKDHNGDSPLHWAIRYGSGIMAALLLAFNADVNAQGIGKTPLFLASERGELEIVKLLLAFDADVNAPYKGMTPLRHAVIREHTDIVELLREHGGVE